MKPAVVVSLCILHVMVAVLVPVRARAGQMVIGSAQQFDYAKLLYDQKDFSTAAVEFKRFIHFFAGDDRIPRARFLLGASLFEEGNFHEAAKIFDALIRESGDPGLAADSCFMQSRAFLGMGNNGYARLVLRNLLAITDDEDVRDKVHALLADIEVQASRGIEKESLSTAKNLLEEISAGGSGGYDRDRRIQVLDQALAMPEKSPGLAGAMAVIPGGGFLYCGRYKDALVAFLMNSSLFWASYTAFDHDNPALGGAVAFVGSGFYAGNIYGSITAAHRHNRAGRIKILNREFSLVPEAVIDSKTWMLNLNYPF